MKAKNVETRKLATKIMDIIRKVDNRPIRNYYSFGCITYYDATGGPSVYFELKHDGVEMTLCGNRIKITYGPNTSINYFRPITWLKEILAIIKEEKQSKENK